MQRVRFSCWCLFLLAALVAADAAHAADQPRRGSRRKLPERTETKVRTAFKDTVAAARQSTVQVLGGEKKTQLALGTIIDKQGFVLTKASELSGELTCVLPGNKQLPAKIVGVYKPFDLAMLKVEAEDLRVVRFESQVPAVGSWLATADQGELPLAIGVVSVKPRKILPPSGMLGIRINQTEAGPRIEQVMPESGAAKAGLQVDDVIVKVTNKEVKSSYELLETLRGIRAGETIKILVRRGEDEVEVDATMGERIEAERARRRDFQNSLGGDLSARRSDFPLALQHDTVLEPNQCGGPVLNLDGACVGINIARAGRVASFAIPAESVLPLLDKLKSGKLAPKVEAKPEPEEQQAEVEKPAEQAQSDKPADGKPAEGKSQKPE